MRKAVKNVGKAIYMYLLAYQSIFIPANVYAISIYFVRVVYFLKFLPYKYFSMMLILIPNTDFYWCSVSGKSKKKVTDSAIRILKSLRDSRKEVCLAVCQRAHGYYRALQQFVALCIVISV